ncbi:hypothetical protein D3C81_1879740 [compost metagenome]
MSVDSVGCILFWKKASGRIAMLTRVIYHSGSIDNQVNGLTECKGLLWSCLVTIPRDKQAAFTQSLDQFPISSGL